MNHPCPSTTPCLPDAPLENLSSERPDSPWYPVINNGLPQPKPPIGGSWKTTHCMGYCESDVSQEAADACAAKANLECLVGPIDPDDPDKGGGWTRPEPPNGKPLPPDQQPPGGGGKPIQTFESNSEECTVYCPDGSPSTGRSDPGEFSSFTQSGANTIAHQAACNRALKNRICFDTIEKNVCLTAKYSSTLLVHGFNPPYAFAIENGELPPGLKIASSSMNSALISGTAVEAGKFQFDVKVSDLTGNEVSHPFEIDVLGLSNDTDTDYPDAQVGVEYSWQFEADGGVGPYKFGIDGYQNINGLMVDEDGFFHGTPTSPGIKDFTIRVQDSTGRTCYEVISVNIQAATIQEFACANEQTSIIFSGYQGQVQPVTFAPQGGEVPLGMDLFAIDGFNAMLDGIPYPAGTYEFTIRATDSLGNKVDQPVQFCVLGMTNVEGWQVPGGTMNEPYSYQIEALGGAEPNPTYSYTLINSIMPTGLTLHANGLIDGTPTVEENTDVLIRVYDQENHFCQQVVTFRIHPIPPVSFSDLEWTTTSSQFQGLCAPGIDKNLVISTGGSTALIDAESCPPTLGSGTVEGLVTGHLAYNGPTDTPCRIDAALHAHAYVGYAIASVEVRNGANGLMWSEGSNGSHSFDFEWGDTGGEIFIYLRATAYTPPFQNPPPVFGSQGSVSVSLYPA